MFVLRTAVIETMVFWYIGVLIIIYSFGAFWCYCSNCSQFEQ